MKYECKMCGKDYVPAYGIEAYGIEDRKKSILNPNFCERCLRS